MLTPRRPERPFSCATICGLLVWVAAGNALAFTPESPEVRAMVERALGPIGRSKDDRLGSRCLRALCFIKYYKLVNRENEIKTAQPVIDAMKTCESANVERHDADTIGGVSNYSLGIALVFLCEHDHAGNRALIERYVAELMKRQKANGSWGYGSEGIGDTSQTQYAVLGMWMAQKVAKIDIPIESQEACAAWLMRTQAPSGGWGYQGFDPGSMTRAPQTPVTQSLSAAGCGSLYILADLLQVTTSTSNETTERPGPFKAIEGEAEVKARKGGPLTRKLEPATINAYLKVGDGWFRNNYAIDPDASWLHYALYARERYESFKDLAEGKWVDEPRWYNDGVRLLQKSQLNTGAWQGQDIEDVATCFAVLFLLRSTQRIIGTVRDLGSGEQKGGLGLPPDVANIQEDGNGRIVDQAQGSIDQVLAILAKGDSPEVLDMVAASKAIELDGDVNRRQSQIENLRKVVTAGEPNARVVAVRTIGKARGLANVPTLLFALTDPHIPVVIEADLALRFVSRKVEGVGLPAEPTGEDIKSARDAWRAWYLSVKPDAELLD